MSWNSTWNANEYLGRAEGNFLQKSNDLGTSLSGSAIEQAGTASDVYAQSLKLSKFKVVRKLPGRCAACWAGVCEAALAMARD